MIEDNRLLTAFKSGNNAAFDALVRKYQDRVYNLCRHMAVVAIGGLMLSTFLTLLYVPIFYTIFEDLTQGLQRKW